METIVPNGATLIVPLPNTPSKPTLRLVRTAAIDTLVAATAPRLLQTPDPDPCFPHAPSTPPKPGPPVPAMSPATSAADASAAIFAASDTDALNSVLPASQPLQPALSALLTKARRQNLLLLAIRPPSNGAWAVQVAYDAAEASLPLNTAAQSAKPAEMLILALTSTGSLTPTAAAPIPVPSGMTIPEYLASDFDGFYAAMLSHQSRTAPASAAYEEFAGPIPQPAPAAADLAILGAPWPTLQVTRLHTLATPETPPLTLHPHQAAPPFQATYQTRVAWKGQYTLACSAGFDYRHTLTARWPTEIAALATLTGWNPAAIRAAMVAHWQSTREKSD